MLAASEEMTDFLSCLMGLHLNPCSPLTYAVTEKVSPQYAKAPLLPLPKVSSIQDTNETQAAAPTQLLSDGDKKNIDIIQARIPFKPDSGAISLMDQCTAVAAIAVQSILQGDFIECLTNTANLCLTWDSSSYNSPAWQLDKRVRFAKQKFTDACAQVSKTKKLNPSTFRDISRFLLHFTSEVALCKRIKGLSYFAILSSNRFGQTYVLAGEHHSANIPVDSPTNGEMGIVDVMKHVRIAFPNYMLDYMIEADPHKIQRIRQERITNDSKEPWSSSNNFCAFHDAFTGDTERLRISYVDGRKRGPALDLLSAMQEQATVDMFHILQKGISCSDHKSFGKIYQLLSDHKPDYRDGESFAKWYDFSRTGDPVLSVARQQDQLWEFPEEVTSKLDELKQKTIDNFGTLSRMYIDLYQDMTNYLQPGYRVKLSSKTIHLTCTILSNTLDFYAMTRFFHAFKTGEPKYAQNVFYLAGAKHSRFTKNFLQGLGFAVHVEHESQDDLISDLDPRIYGKLLQPPVKQK
jgi:hypothetical protein